MSRVCNSSSLLSLLSHPSVVQKLVIGWLPSIGSSCFLFLFVQSDRLFGVKLSLHRLVFSSSSKTRQQRKARIMRNVCPPVSGNAEHWPNGCVNRTRLVTLVEQCSSTGSYSQEGLTPDMIFEVSSIKPKCITSPGLDRRIRLVDSHLSFLVRAFHNLSDVPTLSFLAL